MESKRSKLFFKARERIIDEIAVQLVCDMISTEEDEGIKLPETWMKEADARRDSLLHELSLESVREDEEMGKWAPSATNKKERF